MGLIIQIALGIVLGVILLFALPYLLEAAGATVNWARAIINWARAIINWAGVIISWFVVIAFVGGAITLLFHYPKEVGAIIGTIAGGILLVGLIGFLDEFVKSLKVKWIIFLACILPISGTIYICRLIYLNATGDRSSLIFGYSLVTVLFFFLSFIFFGPTIINKLADANRAKTKYRMTSTPESQSMVNSNQKHF